MPLPIPKLVVFCNGKDEKEDRMVLRLSDAFKEEIRRTLIGRNPSLTAEEVEGEVERIYGKADPDIEVKVLMININYGRNRRILDACEPLKEYAWLIHEIRKNNIVMGIEEAVRQSLNDMPEDFLIKECIVANRVGGANRPGDDCSAPTGTKWRQRYVFD